MIDFEMNFVKDLTDYFKSMNLSLKKSDILVLNFDGGAWSEAFRLRGYKNVYSIVTNDEPIHYPGDNYITFDPDHMVSVDLKTDYTLTIDTSNNLDKIKKFVPILNSRYYILVVEKKNMREAIYYMTRSGHNFHSIINKPYTIDDESMTLLFVNNLMGLYNLYGNENINGFY